MPCGRWLDDPVFAFHDAQRVLFLGLTVPSPSYAERESDKVELDLRVTVAMPFRFKLLTA